jgi:hypothetical protein
MGQAIDGEWGYPYRFFATKKHYMVAGNQSICGHICEGTEYVRFNRTGFNECKACLKKIEKVEDENE